MTGRPFRPFSRAFSSRKRLSQNNRIARIESGRLWERKDRIWQTVWFQDWGGYAGSMIDANAIKARFDMLAPILDERGRRLFAATEARAAGRGGILAVHQATGIARSTIGRGLAELRRGDDQLEGRVRRQGAGRKAAAKTQPGLLAALEELVQSSICGDPEAPLRWGRCAGSARAGAVCPRRWPGKVSPPDRS
jgi:hypothetical protein